ncbi:hypothetical protein JNW88_30025 [Micromonospora sp. ATA32]|nr:hypothetical protein [Micromonospora sp. ATA32]
MLDTMVDHRLARLVERHPRLLEDIDGRCAAVRVLVPLLLEATSPSEAIRVARRVVAHTGTGVDTVAVAAVAHLEDALHGLHRVPKLRNAEGTGERQWLKLRLRDLQPEHLLAWPDGGYTPSPLPD